VSRPRFFLIVLDGCGVGALPDAGAYGGDDPISDTLGNLSRAVGGLRLPHLERLGLGNIAPLAGVAPRPRARAWWGRLGARSCGKDTVTGHWEMMGIVTDPAFPTYPHGFPPDLLVRFETAARTRTLGNIPASGTEILKALGEAHLRTGFPILYTSADSVFQLAAHEGRFGLERLYDLCVRARELLTAPHAVCRVIARPFVGSDAASFVRTENRRDWPLPLPKPTVLDALSAAGARVQLIGKTGELFPDAPGQMRTPTTNNPAHCAALTDAVRENDADFVFANLEDFDMLMGHRNDTAGFARLLEAFDAWLGRDFLPHLRPGDRVGITADHGNDPTTPSTDHSREYAPLLLFGSGVTRAQPLGDLPSLAWWGERVRETLNA
jgi:phosphopentomutase